MFTHYFGMIAMFLTNHIVIGLATLTFWLIGHKYEKGTVGYNIGTIFFLMVGFGLVLSYDISNELAEFKNYFAINLAIFLIISMCCFGYFFYRKHNQ